MNQHTLHKIPWFLIGAGASTLATVFIYFDQRKYLKKDGTKSF